jgi:hypothetical protein
MAADNTVNLIINQKANFQVSFTITENGSVKNLANHSVIAEYKTDFSALDTSALSFTCNTQASNGIVTISLDHTQTANLIYGQKYYYDVVLINDSTSFRTRVVEGSIKVSPGVAI